MQSTLPTATIKRFFFGGGEMSVEERDTVHWPIFSGGENKNTEVNDEAPQISLEALVIERERAR